jgi:hypothetical protein
MNSLKDGPMRTVIAFALAAAVSGLFAVSSVGPASAAKVVTKYGTYEGGRSGSSCLYRPHKSQKTPKHHKPS